MLNRDILFDLDGTLTDPKEGITNSIIFALEKLGIYGHSNDSLEWCIGPPLHDSFAKMLNGDNACALKAIEHYREYFRLSGMYENMVYFGIAEILATLKASGRKLFVATSKPQVFARQILEHFKLADHFSAIYGSELDGTRTNKGELIAFIIEQENLEHCVMVGDREHDIIGAKQNNIPAIGVTWGYGKLLELQKASPDYICDNPRQLLNILTTES